MSEHYFIGGPLDGQREEVPEDPFLREAAAAELHLDFGPTLIRDLSGNAVPIGGRQKRQRYLRRLVKRSVDGKEIVVYVFEDVIPSPADLARAFFAVPVEIPRSETDLSPIEPQGRAVSDPNLCRCGHLSYVHDRGSLDNNGQVVEDACDECGCGRFLP